MSELASPPCKAEFVEDESRITGWVGAWRELVRATPLCPPYATYSWYRAWSDVFGGDKRRGVFVCRQAGRLAGIIPAVVASVRRGPALSAQYDYWRDDEQFLVHRPRFRLLPVRQISGLINLESSNARATLLSADSAADCCWRAWFGALAEMPGWDVARLPCAADDLAARLAQAASAGLYARARQHHMPIYQARIQSAAALLAARSRNFRKQMTRAQVAAAALPGGYRSVAYIGGGEIQQGLSLVYAVAERSWKAQGRSGEAVIIPPTARSREFFARLCAGDEFLPYVQVLSDGTRPFAAALTLRVNERLFGALTFFDPEYAEVSPGRLLFLEMMDRGAALGARHFDLNGGSSFMEYFADDAIHLRQLLIFNRRPYSRLLAAAMRRFSSDHVEHAAHAH